MQKKKKEYPDDECMVDLYYSSNWLNSYSASSLCIYQRPSQFLHAFHALMQEKGLFFSFYSQIVSQVVVVYHSCQLSRCSRSFSTVTLVPSE